MSRGPHPTSTIPALSRARRRVLEAVAAISQDHPVLLVEIAQEVGGHPNTSRQQLDQLTADGLVCAEPVARSGRGRRPLGFSVTPAGRQALSGVTASAERTGLLKAFASYLVTRPDPVSEARAVGELWSKELPIEPSEDELDTVVELLEILGFDPAQTTTEQGDAVLLRACPLLDLSHRDPEVLCEVHRGMIDGVLARVGASRGVGLRPFADPDGCVVVPNPVEGEQTDDPALDGREPDDPALDGREPDDPALDGREPDEHEPDAPEPDASEPDGEKSHGEPTRDTQSAAD